MYVPCGCVIERGRWLQANNPAWVREVKVQAVVHPKVGSGLARCEDQSDIDCISTLLSLHTFM